MTRTVTVCLVSLLAAFVARAQNVAQFDPRMADRNSVVTNGLRWIDGKDLPIEGKAFADTTNYYCRLTDAVSDAVNAGVRGLRDNTAGLQFRFKTSSPRLVFRWQPLHGALSMYHMPSTGMSAIDVYTQDEAGGWRYCKTGRISDAAKGGTCEVRIPPGTPCLVNLPLYNGIRSFSLGIESSATVEALPPHAHGDGRPIVFYGTSITQGGCASRPGLAFVNIIGRDLDVPVVNLGFSGSGKMELEMSEHLATIDASCYVLDCLWNMSPALVAKRYERFLRNLHARRPDVPILMVERYEFRNGPPEAGDAFIRALYGRLLAEGWTKLYYLPKTGMLPADGEGTVDGVHPNDHGMVALAHGFEPVLRKILGL